MINATQVVLDNGTVQIIITKPGGNVAGVKYGGMDNVLDASYKDSSRGYWDMNWNVASGSDTYDLFVLLRGNSGFYTYSIYTRPTGWPDFDLNQLRIVFKRRSDNFQYMAVADNKLRLMPSHNDLTDARSQQLGYKEARLLTNPIESSLKGQ
ncbi:hypothetical protein MARPO_1996s0001, partial [Marchantia polymorpha]